MLKLDVAQSTTECECCGAGPALGLCSTRYAWSSNGDEIMTRCLKEDAISGRQIQDNKIIF